MNPNMVTLISLALVKILLSEPQKYKIFVTIVLEKLSLLQNFVQIVEKVKNSTLTFLPNIALIVVLQLFLKPSSAPTVV